MNIMTYKVPVLNLFDLKDEITAHWKCLTVNVKTRATHRYTSTDLAEILQENCTHRITPQRVGLILQMQGLRQWQDGSDGCKYWYLTPRDDYGHEDFINPKYKSHEKHQ